MRPAANPEDRLTIMIAWPTIAISFSGIQPTGSLHLGNYFGASRTGSACRTRIAVFTASSTCML